MRFEGVATEAPTTEAVAADVTSLFSVSLCLCG